MLVVRNRSQINPIIIVMRVSENRHISIKSWCNAIGIIGAYVGMSGDRRIINACPGVRMGINSLI
jgi:hypothetical protein